MLHGLGSLLLQMPIILWPYVRGDSTSEKQMDRSCPKAVALEVLDLTVRRALDRLCSNDTTKGRGVFNLLKMSVWDSGKHMASKAMKEGAVVLSVETVTQQKQNWKLYFVINLIWCHILLLSWTWDPCKVRSTGVFSGAHGQSLLLFQRCSWMFQSEIWIVLAFILTRLCYCICLTAFKQQKTCTTYLNNTREIKVMRMHCQQMKIKKSCCFKEKIVVARRFWNSTYQIQRVMLMIYSNVGKHHQEWQAS